MWVVNSAPKPSVINIIYYLAYHQGGKAKEVLLLPVSKQGLSKLRLKPVDPARLYQSKCNYALAAMKTLQRLCASGLAIREVKSHILLLFGVYIQLGFQGPSPIIYHEVQIRSCFWDTHDSTHDSDLKGKALASLWFNFLENHQCNGFVIESRKIII